MGWGMMWGIGDVLSLWLKVSLPTFLPARARGSIANGERGCFD